MTARVRRDASATSTSRTGTPSRAASAMSSVAQRPGRHRGEPVEDRLDQHREDEAEQHAPAPAAPAAPQAHHQRGASRATPKKPSSATAPITAPTAYPLSRSTVQPAQVWVDRPYRRSTVCRHAASGSVDQLADEHDGEPAEHRLRDPVAAERPRHQLDQPRAERGQPEHQRDEQAEQQRAVRGGAQRGVERLAPGHRVGRQVAQRGQLVGARRGRPIHGTSGHRRDEQRATAATERPATAHAAAVMRRTARLAVRRPILGTR